MKKILGAALVLSLAATTGFAQGFYVRAGLGYAFPQAGQTMDGTATPYSGSRNNTTYSESYSMKSISFASGTWGALGFGYMFNEHVGAELATSIGLSNTKYTFTDYNVSYAGTTATENTEQQAKTPFMVIPSLVLQTGGTSAWNLYSRLGVILPVNSKITEDQIFNYLYSTVTSNGTGTVVNVADDYTSQIKSSFSLGYTASVGVTYKVNDKISLWGEVTMQSMSLFIKELKLTAVSQNGNSIPLDSVSGPHTVKYSKNVTVDTNYNTLPTYSQPFSNIGVHLGVTFNLGGGHSSGRRNDNSDIDNNKPFRRR